MTTPKSGSEPAFPLVKTDSYVGIDYGLTKREYLAGLAMQALIAHPANDEVLTEDAITAVMAADALLAELAKQDAK